MTDQVKIELDKSNSATVHLYGATLTSWCANGEEKIFVSSKAVYDNKKAIRGGIPLVFPNFGPWELGPQHGFARISRWQLQADAPVVADGSASASFSLVDNESTRAMWNYHFKLLYTVTVKSGSLTTTLTVENTGSEEFDFTTLLHTYFRVNDVSETKVTGLNGLTYTDKLRDAGRFTEERELVDAVGGADRVYEGTGSCHLVKDSSTNKSIHVVKSNLPDTVVWNPWVENAKKMSDFGDDEYKNMICVEAGSVSNRIVLPAGQTQAFSQTLSIPY